MGSGMTEKKLPFGIETFSEIAGETYYYVDKTGLIKELIEQRGKTNLFTRPRRFGKSLNMSMLKCFFETDCDKSLFDGLEVSSDSALCDEYMGKFPVISVSLKGTGGENFEAARGMIYEIIKSEVRRHQYLLESEKLSDYDKNALSSLFSLKDDSAELCYSLKLLSELLHKHHGQKVIILVDEYDVPLAKANDYGYYDQMTILIRNLFEQALKTNDSLYFAVLTGCLKISKESVFTGLNNMKSFTITDIECDRYFGFTDGEVRQMLQYYGFDDHYEEVRDWYDGYLFGREHIYCPWDVDVYKRQAQFYL